MVTVIGLYAMRNMCAEIIEAGILMILIMVFFFFSSGGETVYPLKKGYTAQFDLTPSFSWILKSLYLTSKND